MNEWWGGTTNGYRCLSDSNYDWGQGLKELTNWQLDRHVNDLDVWYFGTDPALFHTPGMHHLPLHSSAHCVTHLVDGICIGSCNDRLQRWIYCPMPR